MNHSEPDLPHVMQMTMNISGLMVGENRNEIIASLAFYLAGLALLTDLEPDEAMDTFMRVYCYALSKFQDKLDAPE